MIGALSAAATGLEAQQKKIENIASDMANVGTDGYKRTSTEFHDLMYETIKEPGSALGATSITPVGVQIGRGVKVGASYKNFEQGPTKMTYNPLDIMIQGPGFLPVVTPQNENVYVRTGSFHVDAQGVVQLSNGAKLVPQITVPRGSLNIVITSSGEVQASLPGEGTAVLGQIQLAAFQNDRGLAAMGEGMYRTTAASGPPVLVVPGEGGTGSILQGALEGSNVNVANSMVDMISTQRAYEMGTKVMGAADQMLGATVNIK